MSRNQSRVAANAPTNAPQVEHPAPQAVPPGTQPHNSPFNFIVPTEVVELPSQGKYYPAGHPLCGAATVEIKHMTAKEEDILTSASLLKKGVALDKMLQSIIVDKRINISDLLIGDKNALLIASRVFGYGANYSVEVQCKNCENVFSPVFDLNELSSKEPTEVGAVQETENNTFVITLPQSNFVVEFRLLTSKDEARMATNKKGGSLNLLKEITVSVNEQQDPFYTERALESLPILDASVLKKSYVAVMPDIDMTQEVDCPHCSANFEMEVPLNAGFFWPDI